MLKVDPALTCSFFAAAFLTFEAEIAQLHTEAQSSQMMSDDCQFVVHLPCTTLYRRLSSISERWQDVSARACEELKCSMECLIEFRHVDSV